MSVQVDMHASSICCNIAAESYWKKIAKGAVCFLTEFVL